MHYTGSSYEKSKKCIDLPSGPIDRLRNGFDNEPRRIDPHPLEENCKNVSSAEFFVRRRFLQMNMKRERRI